MELMFKFSVFDFDTNSSFKLKFNLRGFVLFYSFDIKKKNNEITLAATSVS